MRAPAGRAALVLLAALGSCETGSGAALDEPTPVVTGLDGRSYAPLDPASGRASVLFFVMTDCPIANAYAPEIQSLIDDHAEDPLDFYLVYVDPQATAEALREHGRAYGYSATVLVDAGQLLARRLGVTRTPEAAVITSGGALSYRGRIDDRYRELARRRPQATHRDLREHLRALLDGQAPDPVRTEAVGCFLPDPPEATPAAR